MTTAQQPVSAQTRKLTNQYISHTYSRFELEIVRGQGSIAFGADGREYIDMGSGIATNTFGFCDPLWQQAVTEQLSTVAHTSNLYYTAPSARLAQLLCERTSMARVFFGNSGAEANEAAIKVARKYSAERYGMGDGVKAPFNLPERYTILTLNHSFHGRTLSTLAATGQDQYHELFQPLTPGFVNVPAEDLGAVAAAHEETPLAGVLIELVQGEGGVIKLSKQYVQALATWCAENDVPFMVDEVQTGNGRTGTLYAFQQYGITPDVVSTAKGLGGGLPIGAILIGEKLKDVLSPGDHGSTFGANPICCAGAINVIERLDENLLTQVRTKSEYLRAAFEDVSGVSAVTGMGLLLGLQTEHEPMRVAKKCQDNGVLVLTAKNKVRLAPALNIPMELLERAVAVITASCAQ
ncbi:MAG: acetylornithine transaminase [Arcanobacterium sp.]|nr:acetylornithine transaminase [Arcanobacterium sp.]